MGKKKKTIKVRDKGAMSDNLVETLRGYVARNGFKNLKASDIAEHTGVHASNISRIFGGLDGLVKHLVTEYDYWNALFERFRLRPQAKAWQILEMFKLLMVANFEALFANTEMQHVILGQVTVDDEVMRQISENREKNGAPLLALTDKHFKGSGVNFRMVIALLLGGVYYLVLHAKNNKSAVCGIDINKEEDYQELRETIGYIIELVWRDAGKKRKRAAKKHKK